MQKEEQKEEGNKLTNLFSKGESQNLPQPKKEKFSLALIGCGQRGTGMMIELIQQDYQNCFIQELYLYDSSPIALEDTFNYFCSYFSDIIIVIKAISLDEILQNPDITWVMIASKNSEHCTQAVQCLKAKKHIFCEKPLATTIDECALMRDTANQSNQLFMTGFVLRYSKFYEKIKELLDSNAIGKIVSIEQNETLTADHGGYIFRNWRRFKEQSGPHISEKCCHDIDILNWLVGSEASNVAAFGGNNIFTPENVVVEEKLQKESYTNYLQYKNNYSAEQAQEQLQTELTQNKKSLRNLSNLYYGWPAWEENIDPFTVEKSIEDNLVSIIQFRNGVRSTFHTNCCSSTVTRSLYICGLEGTIYGDLYKGKLKYNRIGGKKETIYIEQMDMHGGGDYYLIVQLYQTILKSLKNQINKEELRTNINHCFLSTVTCLAMDQARMQNSVIDMNEIWKKFNI